MVAERVPEQPVDTRLRRALAAIPDRPASQGYLVCKRIIDVIGASLALLAALPIILLTAIAIKLESSGSLHSTPGRALGSGELAALMDACDDDEWPAGIRCGG